ncbi:hypothetical protein ACQKIE_00075 [Luteibacter sp. NPDC031894]|uniref:hypothetical protein n=1 Tax=Luteibacter sp. NPDC031894 TaxID=3390572 RepID=UPI003CFCE41A
MSRFYVGQRVRVIRVRDPDPECQAVLGAEGVVNALNVENKMDEWGNVGVTIDGDSGWCFLPSDLEPATDANDKIEWSECIWQPEHVGEGA